MANAKLTPMRVGVGIALHIARPTFVARDPFLTSPFQGEEQSSQSENALDLTRRHRINS